MRKLLILILLGFPFTICFAQAGNKVSNDTIVEKKLDGDSLMSECKVVRKVDALGESYEEQFCSSFNAAGTLMKKAVYIKKQKSEYAKINLFDEKGNWIHFSEKTTRAISQDNEKKFAVAYENCVIKKDTLYKCEKDVDFISAK